MKSKIIQIVLLVLSLVLSWDAQTVNNQNDNDIEKTTQKQVIVDGYEARIKQLKFAAPRVLARYRIAKWLWSEGKKDDTGRVEDVVINAVKDLVDNKAEIPQLYYRSLSSDIFALVERNDPDLAISIKKSYPSETFQDISSIDAILSQKKGDKIAVDQISTQLLTGRANEIELVTLVYKLGKMGSAELPRLMNMILSSEESGMMKMRPETFASLSVPFSNDPCSPDCNKRFLRIVISRSLKIAALQYESFDSYLDLLERSRASISLLLPEEIAQVNILIGVLKSRVSQNTREALERDERLNKASDKISALISEAENVNINSLKYDFYWRASQLAVKAKKFKLAVDIVQIISQLDMSDSLVPSSIRENDQAQLLFNVVEKALKVKDDISAKYAAELSSDAVRKSESFSRISKYYLNHNDRINADDMLQKAIKMSLNIPDLARRTSVYIKLLPLAKDIAPAEFSSLAALTAKTINALPNPSSDDKPGSDNFNDCINSIMIVNYNLMYDFSNLIKMDKLSSSGMAGQIDKQEIKILADILVSISEV